jgi:RNA polymerase sigma-70 factor (ECF subfamily)
MACGDQQALGTFYDATSALVYGLALRILGNAAAAEDVTLDVYMQVWRQAAVYNAQRGTPTAWKSWWIDPGS